MNKIYFVVYIQYSPSGLYSSLFVILFYFVYLFIDFCNLA